MTLGAVLGDVGITQSRPRPPATTKPQRYWNIIHLSMNRAVLTDHLPIQTARVTPSFTDSHHRLSSSLTDSRGHITRSIDSSIESRLNGLEKLHRLTPFLVKYCFRPFNYGYITQNECLAAFMERNAAVAAAAAVPDPLSPHPLHLSAGRYQITIQ